MADKHYLSLPLKCQLSVNNKMEFGFSLQVKLLKCKVKLKTI